MLDVSGTVVVRGKPARKAFRFGPWLSEDHVVSTEDAGDGLFVDLVDETALPLGTGLISTDPHRRIRLLSSAPTRDPLALMRTRIERAAARRRVDLLGADAYRLLHGEVDGVPGVFADRFGAGLLVRPDTPELLPLAQALAEPLADVAGAEVVSLWDQQPRLVRGERSVVRFHHGHLVLSVDLLRGGGLPEMTGQLATQRLVRRWARGRVLDAFAGYGGYGLQLADAGASEVWCVEDDPALADSVAADAKRNALAERLTVVREDPTAHLRRLEDKGERFDIVVLHGPLQREPATAADDAKRRAFELNRRALRLLDEGGLLITWAGSTALAQPAFEAGLVEAATKNRKRLQVLARAGGGADHPSLLGMLESEAPVTLVARVVSMA